MKLKKILMLLPLLAVFLFSGCMTAQVELRMEYDKLVKAITAETDKKDDFLKPAANDTAKAVLEYIWNAAHNAKAVAALQNVSDAKISWTTFGFTVTNVSETEKTADAHFMLSLAGTGFTMPAIPLNPVMSAIPPIVANFHWYSVSADSEKVPVYNLIFDYVKDGGEWKISGIKDSGVDTLTLEELQEMMKK